MSRPKRIFAIVLGSIAGLIVLLIVAAIITVQTPWFSNFVRGKLVAAIEDSTGGKVDIGSFQFNPWSLTVRIRNFTLHGTEPANVHPLATISLLELHLKLFSGIAHLVDLASINVQQPQVNLISFPDGKTNIPEPKVKSSGNSNGLQTIVDLKIGQFQVQSGWIHYAQQSTALNGRGENLHALLNYNSVHPSYSGNLGIAPLLINQGDRLPLRLDVNIPVTIGGDSVQIANATVGNGQSKIVLNASVNHVAKPVVDASVNVDLNLPELQRSIALPLDTSGLGSPQHLTAELAAHLDEQSNVAQLQSARLQLGQTTFNAAGTLRNPTNPGAAARFNGNLDIQQLSRLLKVTSPEASGNVSIDGTARLDAQNNYQVNGTISTRDLAVREDGTKVRDVSLTTPFHADPYLISLDGLRLNALGGSLFAKVFVENMQNASVEANLSNFSLPVLATVATGKHLGYDGTINGGLNAKADLKAKGTSGYRAQANLAITPGHHGVPIQGRIAASYNGASGVVDLGNSFLALPHSRLDLSGALNQKIDLKLVSHNFNDFLPALNFESAKPTSSLPLHLEQNGAANVAATVTGSLAKPNVTGRISMTNFGVEQSSFDQLSMDLAASPSKAAIQNGLLARGALRTTFDASIGLRKWSPVPSSPLVANVSLKNGNVTDLLAMAGESSIPAAGDLGAEIHIDGTYGDPLGTATLQVVNGSAYNEPFQRLFARVNLANQLVTLAPLELDTAAGSVTLNASFRHPQNSFLTGNAQLHVSSSTLDLAKLKQVQSRSPGLAGTIHLAADAAASVREVNKQTTVDVQSVNANINAQGLRVNNQSAGDLTLTASTSNRQVNYQLTSNLAGSNINVRGRTTLATDYPTTANASIENLSIGKVLSLAGESSLPASGTLSANADVAGTIKSPRGNLSFSLQDANVYQERINRLAGSVRYADTRVDIPSLELAAPAGQVTLKGSFTHPANTFDQGALQLSVDSTPINVAKIEHLHQTEPTLTGTLRLAADVSADLRDVKGKREVLLSRLNADAGAYDLHLNRQSLGQAVFNAKTDAGRVAYRFDSDLAKSEVHANGTTELSGNYQTTAALTFQNIRYSNIAPFIATEPAIPDLEALVEGKANVSGPVLKPEDLTARLQLDHLEAQTSPLQSPTGGPGNRVVTIQNKGPVVIALSRAVLNIEQFHLTGPDSTINVGGKLNLADKTAPMDVEADAKLDLAVLQDVDHDFYSKGMVDFNATVHGTFAQPLLNGRIELKNANINYAYSPNGLSNANGEVILTGTGAYIKGITGESGGGKITLTGFAGYSGRAITYDIKGSAEHVRVRYSGASVVSNAKVSLTGNTYRSVAAGTVTITRIAYGATSDAGSLLSSFASTPPSTASAPSPILAGMRLAIHVMTAPDLRVATTYANRLSVEANLDVRGTAATPGIVGRVAITDGQLVFFGNTYTVNTGVINFFNPMSIQPIINVSLETLAQGVDVTLGVSGPMNDLQLTYTSDPPLTFEQIVELLATNTTPNDPNIAANQPAAPQQSFTQMGESAILGQAVANPLASRVQRVFGLSEFKIDPSVAGTNGQPTARVTLQQKIANNITFTYITDVTQTNSEIIRVQWDLTPKFSAVGLRDYNGNVSLEFFYKFKVR